jgi:GT2 family glycosyltransferase
MHQPDLAIIIPACDEADCIGSVLDELLGTIDPEQFVVVVGVNGSRDRTAEIARERPVLVAETERCGYGHGCMAAIGLTTNLFPSIRAYLFFAGDGASEPRELRRLTNAFKQGYELVLGSRTRRLRNWPAMTLQHVIANAALGLWAGCLGGRLFSDLGPLRLISRPLFEEIDPQEMTYGWTIETQVAAAKLGGAICELPVKERRRIAGKQKVSGVTWRRTFAVGCAIVAAGWRSFRRFRPERVAPDAVVLRPAASRRPVA